MRHRVGSGLGLVNRVSRSCSAAGERCPIHYGSVRQRGATNARAATTVVIVANPGGAGWVSSATASDAGLRQDDWGT